MKCVKCKELIDADKDKYLHKALFSKGRTQATEDYHIECWNKHFNDALMAKMEKYQGMAMGMISDALRNMNIKVKS